MYGEDGEGGGKTEGEEEGERVERGKESEREEGGKKDERVERGKKDERVERGKEGEGVKRGKEGERQGEAGEASEDEDDDPLPPPPPEQEKELLFLIEFLVDTLTVMQENMNVEDIDPCALQGPARVALTFLHFPPMFLNEKDMESGAMPDTNAVQFNAGKSLMFALTESQFEDTPQVYLAVEATRETPHAFRFPFVTIGKTKIELSELFKQVFDKYDENPGKTVSKSVKDKYDLMGEKGKPAGEITIYIRLTCLGENIVTEFSQAEDIADTVLFKNKESRRVFQCKETEKPEDSLGTRLPGWGDNSGPKSCYEPPRIPLPPPDPEDENFEEIFAEINGSAVLVNLEKSGRKEKPKEFHISEFCDCNIPLPQDLVAGMSDLSLNPVPEGSTSLSGSPDQMDKRVALDSANRLMFPVPPAETIARPGKENSIKYNVKTCNEGDKHGHKGKNSFRVVSGDTPEGPPPNLPNDPEKDVFVFRIIKRSKKDKGKDVLELEFKTPKEKIEPPPKPPYMINREVGPEKPKKEKKKKK